MRRPVDHDAFAAVGYFSSLDVSSGAEARFHLSSAEPTAALRVVRIDRPAPEPVAWPLVAAKSPLVAQSLALGSWLGIRLGDRFLTSDWILELEFRLSTRPDGRVLLSTAGVTVGFGADGAVILQAGQQATGQNLPVEIWLNARLCNRLDRLALEITAQETVLASLAVPPLRDPPQRWHLAGDPELQTPTLNVGIGRITLHAGAGTRAAWHFPPVGRPGRLAPIDGDNGPMIEIHNAPTFGLRSPRWDGSVLDSRLRPDHYDAVALHDDDCAGAGWPVTHRIAVPEDAPSGVYAVEVTTSRDVARWPFFVTPRRRRADLAFLVPTFTYLAYADERLPPARFPWLCDDAGHRFAQANQLTSLYDTHNDGSGVSLASFHRPLATLRDDYRYPLCGAPHLLPVDLHLLRFLNEHGIAVDLLTDGDLHRDGGARLDGYRGLVTGSHPEYWSGAMLDALTAYQARGGHLAYLGGNGGYWVTECDGDTIEVRRGLSGIRTWSAEPGETHLAMTGAPGGLWRHRGRAEHRLLGVGLQAMGFSPARPFRRMPDSHAPELAWLFEGVGDAVIGDTGLVLDGAAGYEVDARSDRWGSSEQAKLLAIAEGFDSDYVVDSDATADGLPEPVRAEMVLTQTPSGGMVFAASSVSWCGGLPQRGTMNAVGCITLNLLQRFVR